jgi:hypothetical protein
MEAEEGKGNGLFERGWRRSSGYSSITFVNTRINGIISIPIGDDRNASGMTEMRVG